VLHAVDHEEQPLAVFHELEDEAPVVDCGKAVRAARLMLRGEDPESVGHLRRASDGLVVELDGHAAPTA
jgi:hypothetical protein